MAAPLLWYFEATIEGGDVVFDVSATSRRSQWLSLLDTLADTGKRIASLRLVRDNGAFSISLPPAPAYIHIKRARCTHTGNCEPVAAYAVGFLAGNAFTLVWGENDGTVAIEQRNDIGSFRSFAAPGTG